MRGMRQKAPLRRGRCGRSLAPITLDRSGVLPRNAPRGTGTLRRWAAVLHHGRISFLLRRHRQGDGTCIQTMRMRPKAQAGPRSGSYRSKEGRRPFHQSGSSAATIQRSSARSTPQARAAARLSIGSTPMPRASRSRTKERGGRRMAGPVPSRRNSGTGSSARISPNAAMVSAARAGASVQPSARPGVSSSPVGKTSSRTRKPRPAKPVTIGPWPASSRRSSSPVRLPFRAGLRRRAAPFSPPGRQVRSCSPCARRPVASDPE